MAYMHFLGNVGAGEVDNNLLLGLSRRHGRSDAFHQQIHQLLGDVGFFEENIDKARPGNF